MSLLTSTRARKLSGDAFWAAMRWLRDPEKAGDASQEAMLALCRVKRAGMRFDRTTAFVRRLGQYKAIDRLRRDRHYRPLDEASPADLAGVGPSPYDETIKNLLVEALRAEIEKLPEFERKVYELLAFQQLTVNEVAKLTDRTPNAISSVYYRAKKRLGHLGLPTQGGRGQS